MAVIQGTWPKKKASTGENNMASGGDGTYFMEFLEARFASIDQRFVAIDQRFVAMDQRFDKVENDLTELKKEVNNFPKWLVGFFIAITSVMGFMFTVLFSVIK